MRPLSPVSEGRGRQRIGNAEAARGQRAVAQFVRHRFQPHQAAHARKQRGIVERLGQEVVGPGVQPLQPVAGLVERRHHDDGNMGRRRLALEAATDIEAVHARHHHVQQDDVGLAALADRQGVGPVERGHDVEILGRKLRFQQLHIGDDVVDDEDAR